MGTNMGNIWIFFYDNILNSMSHDMSFSYGFFTIDQEPEFNNPIKSAFSNQTEPDMIDPIILRYQYFDRFFHIYIIAFIE